MQSVLKPLPKLLATTMQGDDGFNRTEETNSSINDTFNNSTFLENSTSFGMPWLRGMNYLPQDPDILRSIFLVVCICVTTLGNGAVIYIAILRLKKEAFVRLNILIFSLALSDFLQAVTVMIPQLSKRIHGEWVTGVIMCKSHSALRFAQANISICTLALITLERFIYLDKMTSGSEKRLFYTAIIVVLWCTQVALAIPLGIWTTVLKTSKRCTIPVDKLVEIQEYVITVSIVSFFVPLVVMWIGNIGIIYKMRKSSLMVRPLQMGRQMNLSLSSKMDKERRTTLTCLMLALVFTVTLVPFQTCLMMFRTVNAKQVQTVMAVMSYVWPLTILNPCINPFIYSVFIKEIRQRIKKMIICSKCQVVLGFCCNQEKNSMNSSNRPLGESIPRKRNIHEPVQGISSTCSSESMKDNIPTGSCEITLATKVTNELRMNGHKIHSLNTNHNFDSPDINIKRKRNWKTVSYSKKSSYMESSEISSDGIEKSSETEYRNRPPDSNVSTVFKSTTRGACFLANGNGTENGQSDLILSLPRKRWSLLTLSHRD